MSCQTSSNAAVDLRRGSQDGPGTVILVTLSGWLGGTGRSPSLEVCNVAQDRFEL